MFPQTSPIYHDNTIIPFNEPSCIGNQALFLLISAKVDNFYRNLIRSFDPHGDLALQKLLSYCANITTTDKTHYDHLFTTLRLSEFETVTHFLKNFIIAKTRAEIAGNDYSDLQTVDLLLAAINSTEKTKYLVAVQLYLAKRDSGEPVTFAEVERRLLAIDEKDFRDTQQRRHSLLTNVNANAASHHPSSNKSSTSQPSGNNKNAFTKNKHKRIPSDSSNSSQSSLTSSFKTVQFKNPLTTNYNNKIPSAPSSANTTPRTSPLTLPPSSNTRRNN
jgi:hypothetical protein